MPFEIINLLFRVGFENLCGIGQNLERNTTHELIGFSFVHIVYQ
jgi:hypothetical protein